MRGSCVMVFCFVWRSPWFHVVWMRGGRKVALSNFLGTENKYSNTSFFYDVRSRCCFFGRLVSRRRRFVVLYLGYEGGHEVLSAVRVCFLFLRSMLNRDIWLVLIFLVATFSVHRVMLIRVFCCRGEVYQVK